jgi:hypothetical protein
MAPVAVAKLIGPQLMLAEGGGVIGQSSEWTIKISNFRMDTLEKWVGFRKSRHD